MCSFLSFPLRRCVCDGYDVSSWGFQGKKIIIPWRRTHYTLCTLRSSMIFVDRCIVYMVCSQEAPLYSQNHHHHPKHRIYILKRVTTVRSLPFALVFTSHLGFAFFYTELIRLYIYIIFFIILVFFWGGESRGGVVFYEASQFFLPVHKHTMDRTG